VLRDDFVSLFVRGCWLVSFFFTPIYMFILVFVVSFGTKKGTLGAYSSMWTSLYSQSLSILVNVKDLRSPRLRFFYQYNFYRFQHTALTSRLTVYILVLFWCFFFFFGESLLLMTFNYNTLADLIPSGVFVFVKSHAIFMTDSGNAFLGDAIFFFILFFSTSAASFLFNLKYTHTYSYSKSTSLVDITAVLSVCYFFSWKLILVILVISFLNSLRNARGLRLA
jgi:hypothetical protein